MKRKLSIVLVLIGLGGGVWAWLSYAGYLGAEKLSADPQVAELQVLRKEMAEKSQAEPGGYPNEEQMRTMGEKIRSLSDEQRRELFESGREAMHAMMEARMKHFFSLSEEEQQKELDAMIDRIEKNRKEGRGDGPFGGPPRERSGGAGGAANGGAGKNDSGNKAASGGSSDGNASAKTDGAGDGRKKMSEMLPEERLERRKEMLSHTTPENRAMFTEYRRLMEVRMKERGVKPPQSRF